MRFISIALVLTSLILTGCSGSDPVKGTVLQTDCGFKSTLLLEHEDGWASNYVVDNSDCEAIYVGDDIMIDNPVLVKDWVRDVTANDSRGISIRRKEGE